MVVSQEINKLLNSLAEKERRTRSVIAELALQAYAERQATAQTHTSTSSRRCKTLPSDLVEMQVGPKSD